MYSILIADDEKTIRDGIKCLLDWEALGFSMIGEAATGEQARQKILSLRPDVVLMDIRMPGLMGLDVIRQVRREGFEGQFILISGYAEFDYAREAIRYEVRDYLTKPIDEDILQETLNRIRLRLDQTKAATDAAEHYHRMAHDRILQDLLTGNADLTRLDPEEYRLKAPVYQVVIYERYGSGDTGIACRFSDLLRVANQDNHSYDSVTQQDREVVLLKGEFAIQKFNDLLERYRGDRRPQKDSPLDSLFLTYGRCVNSLEDIPLSYRDAELFLSRRFFCEEGQHTLGNEIHPPVREQKPFLNDTVLEEYADRLVNYIQSFNRNLFSETLEELRLRLNDASDPIPSIRLFLTDLLLRVKERINYLYGQEAIPFAGNGTLIRTLEDSRYLYQILRYFTEQAEMVMGAIGNFSRDSVLDDILHYINHNYAGNITLESIAPLFGYNSSYLGKIFSKRMGENFNSYVDHVRIEKSKELLLKEDMKVYSIAEKVGYRNVDYFHIKFKKYMGQSPAEFRKKNRAT